MYECWCTGEGFFPLRFACPHLTHKQTHKWVAVKEGPRLGWDRQLSHASFSASTALCPSFHRDNFWNACVHVSMWERQPSWVGTRKVLDVHRTCVKVAALRIYQSVSPSVRKSTRMWGLSRTINTNTFNLYWFEKCQQAGALGLSLSPHSLQLWLMPPPSQPCRCRLAWYLLKFLYSQLFLLQCFLFFFLNNVWWWESRERC